MRPRGVPSRWVKLTPWYYTRRTQPTRAAERRDAERAQEYVAGPDQRSEDIVTETTKRATFTFVDQEGDVDTTHALARLLLSAPDLPATGHGGSDLGVVHVKDEEWVETPAGMELRVIERVELS